MLFCDVVFVYLKRFVLIGCFVLVLGVYCFMFLRLFGFYVRLLFFYWFGFRLLWLVYVCLDWFSCCGFVVGC